MNHSALFHDKALELVSVGKFLFDNGWSPATSSNYSVRLDANHIAITVSGRPKGELTAADIMVVDLQGQAVGSDKKPSAETLLHTLLYERNPDVQSVLHTHSVRGTVLSKHYAVQGYIEFEDYEVLKALQGITTHDTRLAMPIFPNTQNMPELAERVSAYLHENPAIHGYLIAGHGLYTWGQSVADARRHVEASEFLLECELLRLQLMHSPCLPPTRQ